MSTENGRCYRICKTCGNRWNVSCITKGGGQSYICPLCEWQKKIKPREGSMRSYNTFANRGRDFEDFVIQVNDLYTRSGKAVVYKVPTEFLPIRDSTGQIKSCKVEHKSCVDFLGRYNSIPVAVETKQTHTGRIDFDAVQPHQAAFLDAWTTDKAVGMILVSFGLRRFFAVPWPFWRAARNTWAAQKGTTKKKRTPPAVTAYGQTWTPPPMASAAPEDFLPAWEVNLGGRTGLPYLETIEKMEGVLE